MKTKPSVGFFKGVAKASCCPYDNMDLKLLHFFSKERNVNFHIVVFCVAVPTPNFINDFFLTDNLPWVFKKKGCNQKFLKGKFYIFTLSILNLAGTLI